jgi:hypothetical protein
VLTLYGQVMNKKAYHIGSGMDSILDPERIGIIHISDQTDEV